MPVTSVLIAGVGGQGVVLVSELLALAAMAAGEDVKQGEFHGVAQRGGAVFSHVRFGDQVHSPMAPLATVDYLLALEKLEALRYAHYLKPGGSVIINEHTVEPVRIADQRPYPDDAIDFLSGKGFEVVPVVATEIALTTLLLVAAGLVTQSLLAYALLPAGRGAYAVCTMFWCLFGILFAPGADRGTQYFMMARKLSISH